MMPAILTSVIDQEGRRMNAVTSATARVASRSSTWSGPGLARVVEHALFTVTLAAMGYLCLAPLLATIWI